MEERCIGQNMGEEAQNFYTLSKGAPQCVHQPGGSLNITV